MQMDPLQVEESRETLIRFKSQLLLEMLSMDVLA
jgi:hypothetical protein